MKILPFYTSTGQRDAERVTSWDARLCPRQNLLPFQIQRDHVADTYLETLVLVDCDGGETDLHLQYAFSTNDYDYMFCIHFATFLLKIFMIFMQYIS